MGKPSESDGDDLRAEVRRLSAKLELIAGMITRYGTNTPGLKENELPILDRVKFLEDEVERLRRRDHGENKK